MLTNTVASTIHPSTVFKNAFPYQFVLDFSSTTSLNAAVSAGPFLLRFTAIVMLYAASQLAIRDAPFLLLVAMMLTLTGAER